MSSLPAFVRDLRRRRVFRGAGFYAVGAWSVVQVADVVAEPVGLPAWTVDALLLVAVLLFPLAAWVAWRYDLTGGRLVRTQPPSEGETAAMTLSLGAVDYLVLAALLAMAAIVGWRGLESIRLSSDAENAPIIAAPELLDVSDNSIAVLPFEDLSPNADHAYLADGVSDTVLYVLSRVPGLQVTARTSSFAFRDRALTTPQIAAALGVAHLLEGSVQRAGDEVRVIARLVDARTSREVWSGTYDRNVDAIFAIQDEISENVATALKTAVVDAGAAEVIAYRPSQEAYKAYILGRRELEAESAAGAAAAIDQMERAIRLDPEYALAYIGLYEAIRQQAVLGARVTGETRERVKQLVDRALELEPTLAEAWVARGRMLAEAKDFPGASEAYARALALNENLPEAHLALAQQRMMQGDRDGQLAAIRKAVALDPETTRYQTELARALLSVARAEEARAVLKQAIRKDPDNPSPYRLLTIQLTQQGRPAEGMRYLQALRERDPDNLLVWKRSCEQFLHFWDVEGARACFDAYLEANPEDLEARKRVAGMLAGPVTDEESLREAARLGEREVEASPNQWYPRVQLAGILLSLGEYDRVIALVLEAFPALAADEPKVTNFSVWPARILGQAYWESGDRESGRTLLEAVLAEVERSRKLQSGGWISGVEDALVLCILEEVDRCLDAFETTVDSGWLYYSYGTPQAPEFDIVRDDPRFQEIVARLEANARDQREYYYAKRDEPII